MSTKDESKKPSELKEGDVVSTNLKGMAFTPVILVCFKPVLTTILSNKMTGKLKRTLQVEWVASLHLFRSPLVLLPGKRKDAWRHHNDPV